MTSEALTRDLSSREKSRARDQSRAHDLLSQIADEVTCSICSTLPADAMMTSCGHLFCDRCIRKWLRENATCPVDRQYISRPLDVRTASRVLRNVIDVVREAEEGKECNGTRSVEFQGDHVTNRELSLRRQRNVLVFAGIVVSLAVCYPSQAAVVVSFVVLCCLYSQAFRSLVFSVLEFFANF